MNFGTSLKTQTVYNFLFSVLLPDKTLFYRYISFLRISSASLNEYPYFGIELPLHYRSKYKNKNKILAEGLSIQW